MEIVDGEDQKTTTVTYNKDGNKVTTVTTKTHNEEQSHATDYNYTAAKTRGSISGSMVGGSSEDEFNAAFNSRFGSPKNSRVARRRRWVPRHGYSSEENETEEVIKVRQWYETEITEMNSKFDVEVSEMHTKYQTEKR